ncbi:MAG: RNA-2',3'-PO4:RNA-5'-OH ligase [Candidatus Kapaibacterium sp.]|nr:MAG: RNA-2',3'-PO4:RNA-5'-OH ligase [Candidatus Kapabacteria bacterium]
MEINKIDEFIYEIPQDAFNKMRVPARFYADPKQLDLIAKDESLKQLVNVATLPGIVSYSIAMPDIHQGYGFPIGGVAAFDADEGIISPGGVGYDINCGVRLNTTNWKKEEVTKFLPEIVNEIYRSVPLGTGKGSLIKVSKKEFEELVTEGIDWAIKKGYATELDKENVEDRGTLPVRDLLGVSERAFERGITEIGSLGSGNHFIEIGYVAEIFEPEIAESLGLFKNQIVVWIHTGSRGYGHQICSDFAREYQSVAKKYQIELVDRGLACAPFNSKEGQQYYNAMNSAANFAFVNRQLIAHQIKNVFLNYTKKIKPLKFDLLYDLAHNIAKVETHNISGKKRKLVVHRKGATRSFPSKLLKGKFSDLGQPVLVPGSMGTSSYVLIASENAVQLSFGSSCHGAGRILSRTQAKKEINAKDLKEKLERRGIIVKTPSISALSEEAPEAYKDVETVVNVVNNLKIAKPVAKIKPLAVIKG